MHLTFIINQNECDLHFSDSVFPCAVNIDGSLSLVSTGKVLDVEFGSHSPHHDIQKPKPHCFIFDEGSITVNSLGSVFIAYVPVLQHKGSKDSEDILTGNASFTEVPKPECASDACYLKVSGKETMHVEDPKVKASTDLQQSNNGPSSYYFIQAVQNEREKNVKHVFKTPGCMLKRRESDEPDIGINSCMEDFLPSSVGRNEATDIELSPRLTLFMKEGIVPESPVLNIDHHVATVDKRSSLSLSLEVDKDTKCQTLIHVNKPYRDRLVSQSVVTLDSLCEINSRTHVIDPPNTVRISGAPFRETSMFEKETKRVENTMFEGTNDNNIAYPINEAVHTPDSIKHSSSEDWKCNSGEASIPFFQASKYKRLRKHGDVVRKLPAKTLDRRFKLAEKAGASTMNSQDDKPKHNYGEKLFQYVIFLCLILFSLLLTRCISVMLLTVILMW